MAGPEGPGTCDGPAICTPWARMHRAKLTKSWSVCASVGGWPAAADVPPCPARLATGALPGPDWVPDPAEQAADKAAAAATSMARAGQRRPGGRPALLPPLIHASLPARLHHGF